MDMVRIELPALRTLRLTNIGTREVPMWVVTGPTTDIAAAIAAGGAWVLTRRGPRAVLVDRVVTVDGVPALVPQEPTFESEVTTRQADVADMSTDMLRALLAEREAQERAQDAPAAPVTSATKRTTRTTRKSTAAKSTAAKSASATKRTTRKSASEAQGRARAAAAAAAVTDVSDEDLRALLAQAQ